MNKKIIAAIAAVVVTLSLTSAAHCSPKEQLIEELTARLYLNHSSLQAIYRDLHDAAIDNIGGADRQLSYIQKSYLFVSEANLVCLYQWELLSIANYIQKERRSDYFTLRVKGLRKAIFESKDRINSLMLYYSFIDNAATRRLVDDAIGLIEANIYTYEQLVDMLKPMANPPNPSRPTLQG